MIIQLLSIIITSLAYTAIAYKIGYDNGKSRSDRIYSTSNSELKKEAQFLELDQRRLLDNQEKFYNIGYSDGRKELVKERIKKINNPTT